MTCCGAARLSSSRSQLQCGPRHGAVFLAQAYSKGPDDVLLQTSRLTSPRADAATEVIAPGRQSLPTLQRALQRRVLTRVCTGMTLSISIDGGLKRPPERKHTHEEESKDYSRETIVDVARSRTGWLVVFCIGLLLAAVVVEQFEDVLEHHVELSFFVPLIMGHGGNTGSQAVTTVIRALALKQISNRDMARVVLKEAGAGCLMGSILGICILAFSCIWSGISVHVGATVAMALPLVSLWANGLGALLTILADRLKFDPAVTSVPFMTTIVDSTGLVIYFYIAKWMLGISDAHP